jgi:hypothetical protein
MSLPSLENMTLPVGVPLDAVTVAVSVTDCPTSDGFGDVVRLVELVMLVAVNVAVTLLFESIVSCCGFVVPVRSPVKPANTKPGLALADTLTVDPASYVPPDVTVPALAGLTFVVSVNRDVPPLPCA